MNASEMKARTKAFALRALALADALPRTAAGRALAGQLARSGPSVGANYRSACRARSRAEFASKLGIAVEEADESGYWIERIAEAGLLPPKRLAPLLQEADEITAVLVASHKTARSPNPKSKIANPKSP